MKSCVDLVLVSIPLSRVKSFTTRMLLKYANMLSIELSSGKVRTSLPDGDDGDGSEGENDSSPSSDDEDIDLEGRRIELGVSQNPHAWDDFAARVEEAKERERKAGIREPPKVIVDFGALSYLERPQDKKKSDDERAEAIRRALSLGEDEEIWCRCSSYLESPTLTRLAFSFQIFVQSSAGVSRRTVTSSSPNTTLAFGQNVYPLKMRNTVSQSPKSLEHVQITATCHGFSV